MPNRRTSRTRREVLSLLASSALIPMMPGSIHANRRWGVQLYTVRDLLQERAAETLKAIAAIGFNELELLRGDLDRLVPMARDLGLTPASVHLEAPFVTGNWAAWSHLSPQLTLQGALDGARKHELKYAVVSYLMPGERGRDAAWYQRFAQQMNEAGKAAQAAGITLGYHNHGFEFESLPGGRRPLDILIEELDPALVTFELDVFWVSITGADPVALIEKLPKRVRLLHLKDKASGLPPETDERKVARTSFAEVGSGSLDFARIIKAADTAGVQHLFVEQDHTPGDPIASLRKSYTYLQRLPA